MGLILLLLVLLLIATLTDVAASRIYNWNTYPGILAAFVLQGWLSGWDGLRFSVEGFFACGVIMLLCFVVSDIGGGDVKLIAMIGAFLGVQAGIEALLWTFVLGAAMGLTMLVWRLGAWTILAGTAKHLRLVLSSRCWVPLSRSDRQPLKSDLYLAPASLIAVCIVGREQISSWLTG